MYVRWKIRTPSALQFINKNMKSSKRDQKIFANIQYEYAYLVESYRDKDRKVRQRNIAYLGSIGKPDSLCERTNFILDNLPGLGKRKRIKILKSISEKCGSIRIENERLLFELFKL